MRIAEVMIFLLTMTAARTPDMGMSGCGPFYVTTIRDLATKTYRIAKILAWSSM
jgi:hypothetical protein